jgi:hypothetical protein
VKPTSSFAVHAGVDRYPVSDGVEAIGLYDFCREVAAWQ